MADVTPDPKVVRTIARRLMLDAANALAFNEASRNIGAAVQVEAGGTLGMLEYTAWFQAVYEEMKNAQFAVAWPDERQMTVAVRRIKPPAELAFGDGELDELCGTAVEECDLSGWTADEDAEFEERYGIQAAMGLRAANDRVWAIVQELRSEAVKAGRDPYQDPMAQRLSEALVGPDSSQRDAGGLVGGTS